MSSYSLSSSPANESKPSSSIATSSAAPPVLPLHHLRHLNQSMLSGAGAGLISSVVTCPLDVIKTRLQAQEIGRGKVGYEGVLATSKQIFKQAGIRGFYRGLGPTVLGYLPTWAIYFSVYDEVKSRLAASDGGDGKSNLAPYYSCYDGWSNGYYRYEPVMVNQDKIYGQSSSRHPEEEGTTKAHLPLPSLSLSSISPDVLLDLLRVPDRPSHLSNVLASASLPFTTLQTQSIKDGETKRYRHTLDAIRTIYRTEGLQAFYKGLTPSLMGVSHVAVQFPLYEQLKIWAAPEDGAPLPSHIILLCSALSKMVASLTTYPHEVVRTRLQIQRTSSSSHPSLTSPSSPSKPTIPSPPKPPIPISTTIHIPLVEPSTAGSHVRVGGALGVRQGTSSYKGFNQTVKKIYKEGGWKGFYRGLSINLVRTVPSSAATMLTYELIMRYLTNLNEEHDRENER